MCLQVKGEWRLLYSTISILGSKRTKLGLRDFITLGDFLQIIDIDQVCELSLQGMESSDIERLHREHGSMHLRLRGFLKRMVVCNKRTPINGAH